MAQLGSNTSGHLFDTSFTTEGVLYSAASGVITSTAAGSAGQVLQSAGNASPPAYSTASFPSTATGTGTILRANGTNWAATTATYPTTTTASQILYSSSTSVIGEITTANSAMLVTNSTGVPAFSGTMTNGQVVIGSTSGTPTAATLSAGTGVTITNGAASITVNAAGGGLTWTAITGASQAMSVNNGYIANRASVIAFTLPTSSAVGDVVAVTGINTALGWSIGYTTNQQIFFGTSSATVTTGTLASTAIRDTVYLVCVTANLTWNVVSSIGNITVT